jgi:hypothetical protein
MPATFEGMQVDASYFNDEVLDHCCDAWNKLVSDQSAIASGNSMLRRKVARL